MSIVSNIPGLLSENIQLTIINTYLVVMLINKDCICLNAAAARFMHIAKLARKRFTLTNHSTCINKQIMQFKSSLSHK